MGSSSTSSLEKKEASAAGMGGEGGSAIGREGREVSRDQMPGLRGHWTAGFDVRWETDAGSHFKGVTLPAWGEWHREQG